MSEGTGMKVEEYIQYDGLELASLIRAKEVTAEELLACSQEQQNLVNPTLNAVVHDRYEQAAEELSSIETGHLFSGVPLLLKDISQALAGERLTSGSSLFKDLVMSHDSNYVKALRQGGFVFTGHTNTPEFALKNITEPRLFGPSRNPWNTDHSPGGSSGGATAAVASGIVPIGGASDGGGSIRIPSSFTSLVGLKPTRGKTPVGPGVGRNWQGASVEFVVTRSVRDAAAALDLLQTVQPEAAFQTPMYEMSYLETLRRQAIKPLKIAYNLQSPVGTPVSDEAKKAVMKVIQAAEAAGHVVEEVQPNIDGIQLMRNYYLMNSGEMANVFGQIEQGIGRELTPEDVEIEGWLLAQAGKSVTAAEYANSLNEWDLAGIAMAELHETYDFYVTPSTADVAPKVGELTFSQAEVNRLANDMLAAKDSQTKQEIIYDMFLPSLTVTPFTQLANLTGQPAISLPVHLTPEGLPIGVQVMANKGMDHRLLRVASYFEHSDLWVGMKGNPYFK